MKKIYILIQVLFLSFAVNSQNALDFDGIDDYIGPAGLINSTNSITVEAWINTTNIASQTFPPILYISQMCSLELSGNNIAFWVIGTSGNFSSTQYTINDGQWYHVAGTYDGTTIQLYINGVQQSSVSTGGTNFLTNNGSWVIGHSFDNRFYKGKIDGIRVYNRVLTPSEIGADWNLENPVSTADLIATYNFNQGVANGTNPTVTTLTDSSPASNNGTLNNFSLTGTTSNWVSGVDFSTLSVLDFTVKNSIKLYPNPVIDNTINISNLNENQEYIIYNINGKIVKKGTALVDKNIEIQNLKSGIYYLRINSEKTLIKFIK
jgi:hypothetical protein